VIKSAIRSNYESDLIPSLSADMEGGGGDGGRGKQKVRVFVQNGTQRHSCSFMYIVLHPKLLVVSTFLDT
jgi:hypothetical protein